MVIPHALIARWFEALGNVTVVAYLQRANQAALQDQSGKSPVPSNWAAWPACVHCGITLSFDLLSPMACRHPEPPGENGNRAVRRSGVKKSSPTAGQITNLWSAPLPIMICLRREMQLWDISLCRRRHRDHRYRGLAVHPFGHKREEIPGQVTISRGK